VLARRKERARLREQAPCMKRARGGHRCDAPHRVLAEHEQRSGRTGRIVPVGEKAWTESAKELAADVVHRNADLRGAFRRGPPCGGPRGWLLPDRVLFKPLVNPLVTALRLDRFAWRRRG
jgi:hypothetical protein